MDRTLIAVTRFLSALKIKVDEEISWEAGPYSDDCVWTFKRRWRGSRSDLIAAIPTLTKLNRIGWSIFIRPPSRLIYIDDMTINSRDALQACGVQPCATVQTSQDRLQVWLSVPPSVDAADLYVAIEQRFGADAGARPSRNGTSRLGRLPGFINTKPTRNKQWVLLLNAMTRLESESSEHVIRELAASRKSLNTPPAPPRAMSAAPPPRQPSSPAAAIRRSGTDSSPSGKDCSDAMRMLARRVPAAEVEAMLLARATARNKHSPNDYARRTVAAALRFLDERNRS